VCQITPILAISVRLAGLDRLAQRLPRPVELVIARDDLERPVALVTEHDEVADQGQEVLRG